MQNHLRASNEVQVLCGVAPQVSVSLLVEPSSDKIPDYPPYLLILAAVLYPGSINMRASSPMSKLGSPGGEPDYKVKKNAKGGVLVTNEEIANAFSLLDSDKTGKLTLNGLKKRLGTLFPEMSAKEYRFLMNNKKELNLDDLKELLLDNELVGFDPMYDAFKVFDPDNKGSINEDKLRKAFVSFGMGELSDEELEILKRVSALFSFVLLFLLLNLCCPIDCGFG